MGMIFKIINTFYKLDSIIGTQRGETFFICVTIEVSVKCNEPS